MKPCFVFISVFLMRVSVLGFAQLIYAKMPAKGEGRGSRRTFGQYQILVQDWDSVNRKRAMLFLDEKDKPALYVGFERTVLCAPLVAHSAKEIASHWHCAKVRGDVYSYIFDVYQNSKWHKCELALRFKDNHCHQFRLVSGLVGDKSWQYAKDVPHISDDPGAAGPRIGGWAEPPRDSLICRVDALPREQLKLIEQGRCPFGLLEAAPAEGK